MKLFCKICHKEIVSVKLKMEEAFQDLIEALTGHVKVKHPEDFEEYEELMKDCTQAMSLLPGYLLFVGLVDLDNTTTSDEVRLGFEGLMDGISPLEEIFGSEDDEESESGEEKPEEKPEELPEEKEVNIPV